MTVDRRAWLKTAAVASGATFLASGGGHAEAEPGGDASTPTQISILSSGQGERDYAPALAALARYIKRHLADYGLPGMTFCAADQEGFKAIINVGWSDVDQKTPIGPDHLFQIGSISKSLAAICILRAAAKGRLSLADQVSSLLPGAPLPTEAITVRQLLSHVSGLPDDAPFFPRGGDGRLWTGYAPGSQFSYSNTGYALLGALLERLYAAPYHQIVRREVLEPLGMTGAEGSIRNKDQPRYATGYWPYFQDRPFEQRGRLGVAYFTNFTESSGCVAATSAQMTAYVRYLIQAGQGRGAPLLSDADAVRFTTPVTEAPVFGPKAKYALGLGLVPFNGRDLLHHTGGMMAFSSSLHVDPQGGVGAFASTNARIGDYRPRDVTAYACELMLAARQGVAVPAAPAIRYDDRIVNARDYQGRYVAPDAEAFTLRAMGNTLWLSYGRSGAPVALRRQDDDAFLALHPRFDRLLLVFDRTGGTICAAWWGSARFTREPGAPSPSPVPPDLAALAGLYVNNDPWADSFRVIARTDGLWLDGVQRLVPTSEGYFRVGNDPKGCERVRFDALLDGRPQRMIYSGVDHTRMTDDL